MGEPCHKVSAFPASISLKRPKSVGSRIAGRYYICLIPFCNLFYQLKS